MNKLTINGHTFVDEKIADGNLTLFSSVLSDSLEADECVFTLIQGTRARFITADHKRFKTAGGYQFTVDDSFDFGALKYGDEILFDKTIGLNTSEYLFFLKSVSRVGKNVYQIVGQSTIGMLASQAFKGGVYEGETAKEVIDEIFGDFDFSYGSGFDPYQKLYGWIPYTNSRSALQQVLFALGAVVVRSGAGWPEIRYPNYSNYTAIPDSLVSLGGSIELGDKVSAVELTEYSYFKGESFDVVFDNDEEGETADHALILFEKPAYEPAATEGLTIEESGANYAIVSGRGRLVVSFYSYTQKVFNKTVDANVPENVAKVDSCYLVSPANSYNVLERLTGYYSENVTITNDIAKDLDAGAPIQFTDPFGSSRQGFAEGLSMPISGITKASVTAKCGWMPSNFGNNFSAERRVFCAGTNGGSAAYNWTKPAGVKLLYVALISGGEGGAKGNNGAAGGTAGTTSGGEGGAAGQNGYGGKFNVFRLEVPEETASVSLHAGSGGNPNGGAGGESTISINGVEIASSEDGNESASGQGWADVFTGDRYCLDGDVLAQLEGLKSYKGANGGGGSSSSWHPAGYDVAGYTGGAGGANSRYEPSDLFANGGAGGGAAYGSNGGNGGDGYATSGSYNNSYGGDGGAGGDGAAGWNAYGYGYGHGGGGGNGGGGGGAGGPLMDSSVIPSRQGAGGTGGIGGNGGQGAGGCCIVYY